jgi:hypothetical protein
MLTSIRNNNGKGVIIPLSLSKRWNKILMKWRGSSAKDGYKTKLKRRNKKIPYILKVICPVMDNCNSHQISLRYMME